jgi:hypothetical protein
MSNCITLDLEEKPRSIDARPALLTGDPVWSRIQMPLRRKPEIRRGGIGHTDRRRLVFRGNRRVRKSSPEPQDDRSGGTDRERSPRDRGGRRSRLHARLRRRAAVPRRPRLAFPPTPSGEADGPFRSCRTRRRADLTLTRCNNTFRRSARRMPIGNRLAARNRTLTSHRSVDIGPNGRSGRIRWSVRADQGRRSRVGTSGASGGGGVRSPTIVVCVLRSCARR